jgi:hypothetical protein
MRIRNLSLGDRDQSSRDLNQSLNLSDQSDRQLLDLLEESRRNEDLHSLGLILDECGNRS